MRRAQPRISEYFYGERMLAAALLSGGRFVCLNNVRGNAPAVADRVAGRVRPFANCGGIALCPAAALLGAGRAGCTRAAAGASAGGDKGGKRVGELLAVRLIQVDFILSAIQGKARGDGVIAEFGAVEVVDGTILCAMALTLANNAKPH